MPNVFGLMDAVKYLDTPGVPQSFHCCLRCALSAARVRFPDSVVGNLGIVSFLLNFLGGEKEIFRQLFAQPLTSSWTILDLPSFFHKSQPLCMCCTGEQMRRSSKGTPPKAVAKILVFLAVSNPIGIQVQLKGVRLVPSSPREGANDSCCLLNVLAAAGT